MDTDSDSLKYKRVLLKLSGEALMGNKQFGIDTKTVEAICGQVIEIKKLGAEVAIVVGGGNIFRGLAASERGMDRVTGDNMGMLATVINSLAMMDTLEQMGAYTRVMSAMNLESFAEPYIKRRAIRHMEKGRLVILAGGTGNPFFSTDTAASLRAMEVDADLMIKATNVDGVYSGDPRTDSNAKLIQSISFMDVLKLDLRVMDLTAISLLKDNNIPVRVVSMHEAGILKRVLCGEEIGTLIS